MFSVIGAGSVGLSLSARLARAGHPVQVVTRTEENARALRDVGIQVEDPASGERWQQRVETTASLGAVGGSLALLCVRANDTAPLARALATATPESPVVSVQNGVDNEALLARSVRRVIGCAYWQRCMRVAPTHVKLLGRGRIVLGAWPHGGGADVEALAAALRDANYDVGVSERIGDDLWLKLCINLMSAPNALVRPSDHTRPGFGQLKAELLEEARDVLAAAGITPRSCDGRDRSLSDTIALQRASRGGADAMGVQNSVWSRLDRGGPPEAAIYHRRILDLAEQHGIDAPANRRVLAALLRVARGRLGPESLGLEELA